MDVESNKRQWTLTAYKNKRQWTVNRIYGNGQFIKLTAVDGVSNLWQWTAYQIDGSGCCIKLTAVTLPGYTTI